MRPTYEPTPSAECLPALERGWAHMVNVLFRPFQFEKWIVLGFCAWLTTLGNFGFAGRPFGSQYQQKPRASFNEVVADWMPQAKAYFATNQVWLIPLAVVAVLMVLALWGCALWISSRSQFLFLDGVIQNRAAVTEPWKEFAAEGNSLFRCYLAALAILLAFLLVGLGLGFGIAQLDSAGAISRGLTITVSVLSGLFGLGLIVAGLIAVVLFDAFVIPLMWLRRSSCLDACQEFHALLNSDRMVFLRYLLLVFLIEIVTSLALGAATLLTCCLLGIIQMIPLVGTVVLLPIPVFHRSFSLSLLAQFGPEYDAFTVAAPPQCSPPSDSPNPAPPDGGVTPAP